MGRNERKESDVQTRRNEILDAAERLYENDEIQQVTMDNIAAQAEFTKQTLYRYFTNKEEILVAVYVRAARAINDVFEKTLDTLVNPTGYEMLASLQSALIYIAQTKPLYIKMMAIFQSKFIDEYENMGIKVDIKSQSDRLGKILLKCITQGVSDKSIAQDIDVECALLYINAFISGAICCTTFNKVYNTQSFVKIVSFSMRAFRNQE
jgi:Transcriptional regulator